MSLYSKPIYNWIYRKKIHMKIFTHLYSNIPTENIWCLQFIKNKYAIHISQKLSMWIHSDIRMAGIAMDPYVETVRNLGRTALFFSKLNLISSANLGCVCINHTRYTYYNSTMDAFSTACFIVDNFYNSYYFDMAKDQINDVDFRT